MANILHPEFGKKPESENTGGAPPYKTLLEVYAAYRPVDRRQISLHLRPAAGNLCWIMYKGLLRCEGGHPDGSPLLLVFTSLAVSIEGSNLREVADAIANERCAFVEQFNPARHLKPEDNNLPFVSHITTYTPEHPAKFKTKPEMA